MTFHTTIARLREATADRVQGASPDTCRVRREDLRIALHLIDRLDGELRASGVQAGAPAAGEAQRPVAIVCVRNNGYAMELSTYVAYALPEGQHELYAAPRASKAVRNAAYADAAALVGGHSWAGAHADASALIARHISALKTQAGQDCGDCAKGAAKRLHGLVEEAISWLETGGGRANSLCAYLRKALAAQKGEQ